VWAGTDGGGVARRDTDGRWQSYSKASTQGGLPIASWRWRSARTARCGPVPKAA
jgi:hypothetical protein